jgi:hypothetical protein
MEPMKKPVPPTIKKFPVAKQRKLDELLEKNSEGTITPAEKARLDELVAEAERWMVRNSKLLAAFSQRACPKPPAGALPVTVWVAPEPAER